MRWNNIDEIVTNLVAVHSDIEISKVRLEDLHSMIINLEEFEGNVDVYDQDKLEEIRQHWQEAKEEMEQ